MGQLRSVANNKAQFVNTQTVSDKTVDDTATLGKLLAKTRTERGLSLDDVCKRTRLHVDVLKRLENDDWQIPNFAPSLVRGYLVSYSRFLRIPEDIYTPYLVNFQDNSPSIAKAVAKQKTIPVEEHRSRWVGILTIIILLILLGITGLWWWENHQQQSVERTQMVSNYEKTQQATPALIHSAPSELTLPTQDDSGANLLLNSDTPPSQPQ